MKKPHGWLLGKIWNYMHQQVCHTAYMPAARRNRYPVAARRWKKAYESFERHHMPMHGSVRFLNKFTAHRWM